MVRLTFFSGPDCTDSSTSTIDPSKKLFDLSLATPFGGWTSASQGFTAPANTVSARLGAFGLQLYLDQLYVNTKNQY